MAQMTLRTRDRSTDISVPIRVKECIGDDKPTDNLIGTRTLCCWSLCDPKLSFVSLSDKLFVSGHQRLSCAVAKRTALR